MTSLFSTMGPLRHCGANCKTLKQTPYSDNKASGAEWGRGGEIKSKLMLIKCSNVKCRFSEEEFQNK